MSQDIQFDPIFRDIVFSDNDFSLTNNPSTQNGGIILESRVGNLLQPQVGTGFNSQVLGDNVANAAFELNRTVSQIVQDGGTADWKSIPPPPNTNFDFSLNVNYPE